MVECECFGWLGTQHVPRLADAILERGLCVDSRRWVDLATRIARFSAKIGCITDRDAKRVRAACQWTERYGTLRDDTRVLPPVASDETDGKSGGTVAACDCFEWLTTTNILALAYWLTDAGFVDRDDEGDLAMAIAKYACKVGCIDESGVRRVRSMCRWPEQRRIIEEYAKFARTTNHAARRAEKIRALGVSRQSITRWARKHFGEKWLSSIAPPSCTQTIAAAVRARRAWLDRHDIARISGVRFTNINSALEQLVRRGILERRKGPRGVYVWRARKGG